MSKQLRLVILQRLLSRRHFLVIAGQVAALIGMGNNKSSLTAILSEQSTPVVYGQDSYGQGEYPGYNTYLPLVNKENQ
jgi:hypothetical protein